MALVSRLRLATAQAAALLLLGLVASQAHAGGFHMATFGARRGGQIANMGAPDDVSALFSNPAGLADQPGTHLYLFVAPGFLDPDFRLKALDPQRFPAINPYGCGTSRACPYPVDEEGYYRFQAKPEKTFGIQPFIGVATTLEWIHPKLRQVSVGWGVYAPNVYAAFLSKDAPTAYHIIGGMMVVAASTWAVGWRINRYIAVGANVSYNLMYLSMKQKLSLVDALSPPGEIDALASAAQELIGDIQLDYQGLDHGAGWGFSLLLNPTDWMGIGFSYLGATSARYEGDVRLAGISGDAKDPDVFAGLVRSVGYKLPKRLVVEMPIPPSFAVGINVRIGFHVEVGFEARFWLYQLYKRQVLRPIYDPDEEGDEPFTEEGLSRDKKYKLSYQLTGGFLIRPWRRLPGLELMVGTGYDESPIPDETFSLDNPSLSHFKVAGGVRWRINAHWRVALTYYLNIFVPRDIRTSETNPPTNVQGSGYSHSPGLEMTYTF